MGAGDRAPGPASRELCLLIQKLRPPRGGVRALEDLGRRSRTRPWPKHSQWAKIVNGESQISFEVLDELIRLHYEAEKPPRAVPQAERKRAAELWKSASGDYEQTSVEVQLLELERRLRQTTETQLAMQVIINAQSKAIDGLSVLTMKLLEERNHVTSDARRTQSQLDQGAAAAHRRQLAALLQTLENSIAGIDLRLIRAEHQRVRATRYRSEAEQLRSQAIHDAARLRETLDALGESAAPVSMDTTEPCAELDVSRSTLSMDSVDDVLARVDEQQDDAAATLAAAERQLHADEEDEGEGNDVIEGEVLASGLHASTEPDGFEVTPSTAQSPGEVDVLYFTPNWYGQRDDDPSVDGRAPVWQPDGREAAAAHPREDLGHLLPAPDGEQVTLEEVPPGAADTAAKVRRLPPYPTRGRRYPHARRHGQGTPSQPDKPQGQDEVVRETAADNSTPAPANLAAARLYGEAGLGAPEGQLIPRLLVSEASADGAATDTTSSAEGGPEGQATASTGPSAAADTPVGNPDARAKAPGATDFGDIFSDIFGQLGPRPRAQRGQDATIRLKITLDEAALGTTKKLKLDTAVTCTTCNGEGTAPGTSARTCGACHGKGQVPEVTRTFIGQALVNRPCQECQGSGTVIPRPCSKCKGDGRVRRRRTLTVQLPAGVDNGTRIRLAGEGEAGTGGGPAGDLYVEIAARAPGEQGLLSRLRHAFNGR